MDYEKIIYQWVKRNFGESEADDPSWNIKALADYIKEEEGYFVPQLETLTDKGANTLQILRNATWLDNDDEIETACGEVANYLKATK